MSNMSKNNVKKFAQFGIVLVAAITVATAAQSQGIGTVTQHVYAEEVTSYNEDSRMFYIKDSFYPNLEDYMGFAGRVTTADKPYTVEEGSTTPEYPYYTIVGSDGKTYSVGDTITVDNPLVNHPNEEDNVLYYYHYPSDPNAATSEAPAPSVSPSTSESPNTSTSPSTSEAPAPSTSPSTSEAPAVEKPSQKTDDKTTATEKAKAKVDKKTDSKKASDKVKVEKSKDANSKKAVAAKDNSTSKTAEASAPAEQAKATVKANANVNPTSENSQAIVKQADGTVDTAAVHNDNTGFLLTMLGFVSAAFVAFIALFKKEEK